jgi:hypothetical protein
MTPDPLTAALAELAAYREQLTALNSREGAHHAELSGQLTQLADAITAINRALAEDAAALARLDTLEQHVADLARRLSADDRDDSNNHDGYRPRPAPAWHKITGDDRRAPIAELRDWVERIYRPGYGHLSALLGGCWAEHDLCLYGLDIASQLWCALYLEPHRSTSLLSAQAEYQGRLLPALAAQLAAETTRCRHTPVGRPRSLP